MALNLAAGVLEQAAAEAGDPDPVTAGLARGLLEAARGEAGARFTVRRALAQAAPASQPGAELRRRVLACVAAGAWEDVGPLLAHALPGLRAGLALGGDADPIDVMGCTMAPGGSFAFELSRAGHASPHLPFLVNRWLSVLPVFAAAGAMAGPGQGGACRLNLGSRQRQPGLTFSATQPSAWLLPETDFLSGRGHARLRQQAPDPDWAALPAVVAWRGNARDHARLVAAVGEAAGLFDLGTGAAAPQVAAGRYTLELDPAPGSAGLFALLLSGAAVLRVAAADGGRSWVDTRLVAWTHYVPVAADLSDLALRAAWLDADPARAEAIARSGRAWAIGIDFEAELAQAAGTVLAALHAKL